jgi:hypothetical protein
LGQLRLGPEFRHLAAERLRGPGGQSSLVYSFEVISSPETHSNLFELLIIMIYNMNQIDS